MTPQPIAVGAVIALVAAYVGRVSAGASLTILGLGLLGLLLGLGALNRATTRARVRVDADGIVLSGILTTRFGHRVETQTIARSAIAHGYHRPRAGRGHVVLLDAQNRELLELDVGDEAQGLALLASLGLDASKRLPIDVGSPLSARVGFAGRAALLTLFSGLAIAPLYAGLSPLFAIVALAAGALVFAWPMRADIAADGVALAWLGWRRFVPFAAVTEILETRGGALLVLRNGERVFIPRAVGVVSGDAMVARLRDAFAVHQSGGDEANLASVLARGVRDSSTWIAHLRALRDQGYRTRPVRDEDLWRVVEDAGATAEARGAAALLLRPALDEPGRARLRVASEETASPRLRVVLEAAAVAEDDAELEEPLARLSEN